MAIDHLSGIYSFFASSTQANAAFHDQVVLTVLITPGGITLKNSEKRANLYHLLPFR
jgi:hypothetical protein